jgi:putative FmdB family regulatory protein
MRWQQHLGGRFMPLYDLACRACGQVTETVIPLADFHKELRPCECGGSRYRKIAALQVMGDIEPYQAVAVDRATGNAPMITSRAHHREFMKRNGYEELGNDKPKIARDDPIPTKEIGQQIKQTIEQKGIRL